MDQPKVSRRGFLAGLFAVATLSQTEPLAKALGRVAIAAEQVPLGQRTRYVLLAGSGIVDDSFLMLPPDTTLDSPRIWVAPWGRYKTVRAGLDAIDRADGPVALQLSEFRQYRQEILDLFGVKRGRGGRHGAALESTRKGDS